MTGIELLGIPMATAGKGPIDVYSGVARMSGKVWGSLHRSRLGESRTAVVITHPTSNFLGHYLLGPLAERGVDAIGLTNRYLGNDSTLIMENCVVDMGAAMRFLRDERGYTHVALIGNSGGGGLSAFYQSQAESPTVTETPAGDPPDLTQADLPPADTIIQLMAHPGRAIVYSEWLDPAIVDEHDPSLRDPELDMFDERNGPPYAPEFVARYRQAQLARSHRIATWVREQLGELAEDPNGVQDLPFTVHGTTADPRFLDPSIDPSDRTPGTLWGPPAHANLMPASLGHASSLRSWLSQWSHEDSNCDGPEHLARVRVPVLTLYGTADQVCFPSHAISMHERVPHDDKRLVPVEGGTHYLQGQPEHVAFVADTIVGWLDEHGLRS